MLGGKVMCMVMSCGVLCRRDLEWRTLEAVCLSVCMYFVRVLELQLSRGTRRKREEEAPSWIEFGSFSFVCWVG